MFVYYCDVYRTIASSKSSIVDELPLPNLRCFNGKGNGVGVLSGIDIICNVYEFTVASSSSSNLLLSQNDNDKVASNGYTSTKLVDNCSLKTELSIMNQYFDKSCHAYRFDLQFPDPVAEYRSNNSVINDVNIRKLSQIAVLVLILNYFLSLTNYIKYIYIGCETNVNCAVHIILLPF